MGPTTTPSNPKTLMPPSTLIKTTKPPISARPLMTQGRRRLSTNPTTTLQKTATIMPAVMWPSAIRLIAAGDRHQREKSHHHAPKHRSGDSRQAESQSAENAVRRGCDQAGDHARENQIVGFFYHAFAMRRIERQDLAHPGHERGAIAVEIKHRQHGDAEMKEK